MTEKMTKKKKKKKVCAKKADKKQIFAIVHAKISLPPLPSLLLYRLFASASHVSIDGAPSVHTGCQ
jgi:hypothetical protein